jgi:hypothetical protein
MKFNCLTFSQHARRALRPIIGSINIDEFNRPSTYGIAGECAMHINRPMQISNVPVLHVFEQNGRWHWGITVPRARGTGFKLVAYSEEAFLAEDAARMNGNQSLASFSG